MSLRGNCYLKNKVKGAPHTTGAPILEKMKLIIGFLMFIIFLLLNADYEFVSRDWLKDILFKKKDGSNNI